MKAYIAKLEVGQFGWFVYDNIVQSRRIDSMQIQRLASESGALDVVTITYGVRLYDNSRIPQFIKWLYFPESRIFASKQELLESL